MFNMFSEDAQQSARAFLLSQKTHIETAAIDIRYPDIQYPSLIPIDTSANEWAKSITFFSNDRLGRAQWFHHMAKDIPRADVVREKFEHTIEMAAIGYGYTLQELGEAQLVPGTNLQTDRAAAARRAYEEFMEDVAFRGDTEKAWTGLVNDPNVSASFAEFDGTGSSSAWSDKTADQVLRDLNDVLTGIWVESLTVEMADTLLLPLAAMSALATRRIPETTMTIMEFIKKNNAYTMNSGAPLTIRAVRGLETAGEGDTGRIVAYRKDAQVLKMHIPMAHRFLGVWQDGPLQFEVPGIFRTGGVEIRRPGAVRYLDGVLSAEYE
jgi:hypothetical protein